MADEPTKAEAAPQMIVEEGLGQDVMDRVKRVMDEEENGVPDNVVMVENKDNQTAPDEVSIDLSKPEDTSSPEEAPAETPETEASQDEQKITLTQKGKEREFTMHELKSIVGREETFQKKFDGLQKSEEVKLGTLVKAAQDGDRAAQKKIQKLLVDMTGASDGDDMLEKLDDVEGDFDENKALADKVEKDKANEAFEDVKDNVDFQDNMSIVNGSLKERMPAKVWEAYNSSPQHQRALYDLAASGRLDSLFSAFEEQLNSLPFEKQLEIEGDPDSWGHALAAVIRRENAAQADTKKPETGDSEGSKDGLDAVSDTPKAAKVQVDGAPDFDSMSSEEFAAWKRKHKIPPS